MRGALELLELSRASSEMIAVLASGQDILLRKKLANLEAGLEAIC